MVGEMLVRRTTALAGLKDVEVGNVRRIITQIAKKGNDDEVGGEKLEFSLMIMMMFASFARR